MKKEPIVFLIERDDLLSIINGFTEHRPNLHLYCEVENSEHRAPRFYLKKNQAENIACTL